MNKTKKELEGIKKLKDELLSDLWYLEFLENGGVIGKECDLYTEKIDEFYRIKKKYTDLLYNEYWVNQQNWSLSQVFPERYKHQQDFFDKCFIPYLDRTQRICDLASANGEWSIRVAKYVKWIDGFEYAAGMVDYAKKEAEKMGIENVSFFQADACELSFDNIYDNFMMMGLLTCIFDDKDAKNIVQKVCGAIKKGGRLIVKDTLNAADENVIYMYNFSTRYEAVYRSKEEYYKLFLNAGFTLEKDIIFHEVENGGLVFRSIGALWKKE